MWRVLPALLLLGAAPVPPPVALDLIQSDVLPPKLSEFRFFNGTAANTGVRPYALNTALFSDYTDKDRFLYLPPGTRAVFDGDGLPVLPVGAALIKTFRSGATKIETRVMLHRAGGWVALPYVWQGDEAVLKRAGTRVAVTMTVNGQAQAIDYAVPNVNQCKECHASNGIMTPIGPKARNLTPGMLGVTAGGVRLPKWGDSVAPLEARARAYLDVNCGHCHNPKGAASNSGLNLTWETTNRTALGIGKTPVAAGRGSGGHLYAIDPGHPERSIMVHRMATAEPGVAMPEVGRLLVHKEGVKLVSDWIAGMKPNG